MNNEFQIDRERNLHCTSRTRKKIRCLYTVCNFTGQFERQTLKNKKYYDISVIEYQLTARLAELVETFWAISGVFNSLIYAA